MKKNSIFIRSESPLLLLKKEEQNAKQPQETILISNKKNEPQNQETSKISKKRLTEAQELEKPNTSDFYLLKKPKIDKNFHSTYNILTHRFEKPANDSNPLKTQNTEKSINVKNRVNLCNELYTPNEINTIRNIHISKPKIQPMHPISSAYQNHHNLQIQQKQVSQNSNTQKPLFYYL